MESYNPEISKKIAQLNCNTLNNSYINVIILFFFRILTFVESTDRFHPAVRSRKTSVKKEGLF